MYQSYFDTLAEALRSESTSTVDLVALWPNLPISYGQTIRVSVDDGTKYGRIISVYRNENGRYERPVTYQR